MYGVMFVHQVPEPEAARKELDWLPQSRRLEPVNFRLSSTSSLKREGPPQRTRTPLLSTVCAKNPTRQAGRAMDAADGLYEFLRKRVDGHVDFTPNGGTTGKTVYQIKPFALPRITPGNIGEVFYQGTSMIPSVFPTRQNRALYPLVHAPWYHKYNETHYGQNQDYKAGINYVKEFPGVKIETIPNATPPSYLLDYRRQYSDLLPDFRRNAPFPPRTADWTVKVWSNWKESIQATAVGYKYINRADMDGSRQLIWCNDYDLPKPTTSKATRIKIPTRSATRLSSPSQTRPLSRLPTSPTPRSARLSPSNVARTVKTA